MTVPHSSAGKLTLKSCPLFGVIAQPRSRRPRLVTLTVMRVENVGRLASS